ncbi:RagB/SusD family nutrient uptake outer membrane protein [Asinibacterium sp. OR53]|uniref:RagB/SusD family nutrient uptake outer membrane protein n=1 Tax=Asinibacterium sp. OR53 TaxID=925409 RepID=UPI00047C0083|nr:RagB/SusD family nutrient uptake outer membrane protein [Asinibacterium sp. OR53]
MKKHNQLYILILLMVLAGIGLSSCKKHLDYQPKGALSSDLLNNANGAELLATAAYASLGNGNEYSSVTDWIWGSVRSDDAYKGGASTGDQPELDKLEQFSYITVDQSYIQNVWIWNYEGIARANLALSVINKLNTTDYPMKVQRQAEMRFLRAHFYFWLAEAFKNVPWIDENMTQEDRKKVSNRQYTRDQLYEKIATDFQFGIDNLPERQSQIGRASKVAAAAYLARTRLFQAYQQDENHNVTGINPDLLNKVIDLTGYIMGTGKHRLSNDFAENFLYEFENGPESVFAIQFSKDDGTPLGREDWSHNLNYNMAPQYGCCSFHRPSDNLVNAFKTDTSGLPRFATFNDVQVTQSQDFFTNSFDPRLDHTVGIPTHSFKYDPNFVYQASFARAAEVYGVYSTMKEIMPAGSPALKRDGSRLGSAKNADVLRYDDVLLWRAEALIELNRQAEALPLINQIRTRAANSTGRLKTSNGSFNSRYNIQPYVDGVNCQWTKDFARMALRWERRLEFAAEGARFFDLVRWGIAAETLNGYFKVESGRHPFLKNAVFQKNRNEYLPIPQQEITLSEGLYKQNPGY